MRSSISIRGYARVHPFVTHELKPWSVFNQNYYQYERERILCRASDHVLLSGVFVKSLFFSTSKRSETTELNSTLGNEPYPLSNVVINETMDAAMFTDR